MPELPEVETVRCGLLSCLPGRKITGVELFPGHTIRYPTAHKFCSKLIDCTFEGIDRRGKYLLFQLAGGKSLVVHLGMSGRLLLTDSSYKSFPALTHVRLSINIGSNSRSARAAANSALTLCLQDPRRFSRVWFVGSSDNLAAAVPSLMQLGVEPLSKKLNEEYLRIHLFKRKQSIKAVLLDQTVIAGLGNIYADESLFAAGIHPLTSAQQLTRVQRQRLIDAIKSVLNCAIEKGGSSLRNYTDTFGTNGNYQNQAKVYARSGQACRVCGTLVRKTVVMARSTHFCPHCQRAVVSTL